MWASHQEVNRRTTESRLRKSDSFGRVSYDLRERFLSRRLPTSDVPIYPKRVGETECLLRLPGKPKVLRDTLVDDTLGNNTHVVSKCLLEEGDGLG